MRVGCVVMASGEGKRFRASGGAGNKLLACAGGLPLVARTVQAVPAELADVVVPTCWDDVARVVAENQPSARIAFPGGPMRSDTVRAGLAFGQGIWDACLFLPGDQPLVSRESFYALCSAHAQDPARAYRLSWDGVAASPVLFPGPALGR